MGRTACTEPQCLYSIAIPLLPLWAVRPVEGLSACTVQLYLYSPQCLYSIAIPLLPLLAVRSVQTLSACTVQLHLYYPYRPYGLYRASVPVQGCPLLLLYTSSNTQDIPLLSFLKQLSAYKNLSQMKFISRFNVDKTSLTFCAEIICISASLHLTYFSHATLLLILPSNKR